MTLLQKDRRYEIFRSSLNHDMLEMPRFSGRKEQQNTARTGQPVTN